MAQIIDFLSRKELIEKNKNKITPKNAVNFSQIATKNKQAEEKRKKERDIANKNVMKNYKIK
jgi:hypothetical protein